MNPEGKREIRKDSAEVQLKRERCLGSEKCRVVGVQERVLKGKKWSRSISAYFYHLSKVCLLFLVLLCLFQSHLKP